MELKAIEQLLEECEKCGSDMFGYIHYVSKEKYEDAQREYTLYLDAIRKRTT